MEEVTEVHGCLTHWAALSAAFGHVNSTGSTVTASRATPEGNRICLTSGVIGSNVELSRSPYYTVFAEFGSLL